ncbi:MAG: uroporphyrinogen decarboxylase family protein [Thermodesulfobacteriota bacterium]
MNWRIILQHIRDRKVPPMGLVPEPMLNLLASMAGLRGRFQELSNLERMLITLCHKEPDRVPVTPILCSGARQISGITFPDFALDAEKAARVYLDGFEFVGGDAVVLLLDLSVEAADFGQAMVYPERSTPQPDYNRPMLTGHEDYRKVKPVRLSDARRMSEFVKLCRIMVEKVGWRSIVSGFVFGPLGVLNMMRGAEHLFKDCLLYPNDVKAACETITGVLIEYVQAQCAAGVPAVAIDTLFASRSALPKDVWEDIEGPFAREISRAIKATGHLVGIHNCGDAPYFDAQIRSMEPEFISFGRLPDDCQTPQEMKQKYGDQTTLLGYVPTALLVHGTPKEVMDEAKRQIDVLAPGGGFILAPECEYPPNIPLTNAFALIKAAKTYGRK